MTVAFTLDIGNSDRLTAGFKDLHAGKLLPYVIHNVGTVEFGTNNTVFYTECDLHNRPCAVK